MGKKIKLFKIVIRHLLNAHVFFISDRVTLVLQKIFQVVPETAMLESLQKESRKNTK